MDDNTQDLQKQLLDAKEQLNWLRKNFNEEINVLIKENRELKEQLKDGHQTQVGQPKAQALEVKVLSSPPTQKEFVNIEKPSEIVKNPSIISQEIHPPKPPEEISSIRWVYQWAVCKFKDWFIRLPCTIALLLYHIFAIQYHKHLCNKR